MRAFEYHHVVGFEETNLVGNVYYANHIRWQGRCREFFLRERAPDVLEMIGQGLALVTVRVTCEYYRELAAFDELIIRMQLLDLSPHRMSLQFDYWVRTEKGEELAARGEQDVACMMRRDGKVEPAPWPESLREALRPYAPG